MRNYAGSRVDIDGRSRGRAIVGAESFFQSSKYAERKSQNFAYQAVLPPRFSTGRQAGERCAVRIVVHVIIECAGAGASRAALIELNHKAPLPGFAKQKTFASQAAHAMDLPVNIDKARVIAPEQADGYRFIGHAAGIHREQATQRRENRSDDILSERGVQFGLIVQDL